MVLSIVTSWFDLRGAPEFTVGRIPIDLGIIIGIFGVIAGIAGTVWGSRAIKKAARRDGEPKFRFTEQVLLRLPGKGRFPPVDDAGLAIFYNKTSVRDVRRGYLAFWNASKYGEIDPDKNVDKKPYQWAVSGLDGFFILQSATSPRVVCCTRDDIAFQAVVNPEDPAVIDLTFKFLGPNQGALVEFLYTGVLQKGELRGLNKNAYDPKYDGDLRVYRKSSFGFVLEKNIIGYFRPLLTVVGAAILFFVFSFFGGSVFRVFGWFLIVMAAALVWAASMSDWDSERPVRRDRKIPEALRYWPTTEVSSRPLISALRERLVPWIGGLIVTVTQKQPSDSKPRQKQNVVVTKDRAEEVGSTFAP